MSNEKLAEQCGLSIKGRLTVKHFDCKYQPGPMFFEEDETRPHYEIYSKTDAGEHVLLDSFQPLRFYIKKAELADFAIGGIIVLLNALADIEEAEQ